MLSKYSNCTRLLKIKKKTAENRLFLLIMLGRILDITGCFYQTNYSTRPCWKLYNYPPQGR